MNIGETTLSFLQEDCVREFGEKDGERLFRLAEQEYQRLLCAAGYRNSGGGRGHPIVGGRVFPEARKRDVAFSKFCAPPPRR